MKRLVSLQEGQSSVYFIICIMVVLLAVSLVGGFGTLMSGDTPFPVEDTPAASSAPSPTTATNSASITPSPTVATVTWNMDVTLGGCERGYGPYMSGNVSVEGPTDGSLEIFVGSSMVGKQTFTHPKGTFPLTLRNDLGFNNNDWKITVTSEGEVQKTYNGTKTGCK